MEQQNLENATIRDYSILDEMYTDAYYPNFLVDKCKSILVKLCFAIESQKPQNIEELYKLTHSATEEFNGLMEEFWENDSDLETVARECICANFDFIGKAYNFDVDAEDVVGPRDW